MRHGRSFPLRRFPRPAKPIGVSVFATGTAPMASSAKITTIVVVAFATGTAPMASSAKGTAWIALNVTTNPLDGVLAVRVEQVRFEILDINGNVVNVLHPTAPGSVSFNPQNRIARTLTGLRIDPTETSKLTPGVSRIRPVWIFANSLFEYPVGVFLYMGGSEDELSGGTWITCAPLPDRSQQLAQKISDMIAVASGAVCTDSISTIAAGAGITTADMTIAASPVTVGSTPLTFALGQATRLDILAKLTDLLGYLPVYFDNNGRLVARPIPVPADTWPDVVHTTGQKARVLADTVSTVRAITQRPNVYLVRSTSPSTVSIAGRYNVPATAANSVQNVGYEIVEVHDIAGLANSTQANAAAAAQARRDDATVRTVVFSGMADPRHDGWNVVEWQGERMLEINWTLELQPGGKHTHTLASVYA